MGRWTALDPYGNLSVITERTAKMSDGVTVELTANPYTPVYAADGVGDLLVYREWHPTDNSLNRVLFASTRPVGPAWQGQLAESCEGKWPLAICALGQGRFLVAWIERWSNVSRAGLAVVDVGARTITPEPSRPIPPSMMLLEVRPDRSFIVDDTGPEAGGRRFVDVVRGGVRRTLVHVQEVNGRVVGVDAGQNAPNRVLLADQDGWFQVAENDKAHLFPPRLDMFGNVTTYEGDYWPNMAIRTRPADFTPRPEPSPALPPVPKGLKVWAGLDASAGALVMGNCTWSGEKGVTDPRPAAEMAEYADEWIPGRRLLCGLWLSDNERDGGTVDFEVAFAKSRGAHAVYIHWDDPNHRNVWLAETVVGSQDLEPILGVHVVDSRSGLVRQCEQIDHFGPWGATINVRTHGRTREGMAGALAAFVEHLEAHRDGLRVIFVTNWYQAGVPLTERWPELAAWLTDFLSGIEEPEHLPGWKPEPVPEPGPEPEPTPPTWPSRPPAGGSERKSDTDLIVALVTVGIVPLFKWLWGRRKKS